MEESTGIFNITVQLSPKSHWMIGTQAALQNHFSDGISYLVLFVAWLGRRCESPLPSPSALCENKGRRLFLTPYLEG